MKSKNFVILIRFYFVLLASTPCVNAETMSIAFITSAKNSAPKVQFNDLEAIYRRQVLFDERGNFLVPVNLSVDLSLRRVVSSYLFDAEPRGMEAYWNERYFHGVSPPHVVASTEAMLRFIHVTEGALGYVLDCHADKRVTVLWTVELVTDNILMTELCSTNETEN